MDDVGQYERAFSHWLEANALKRHLVKYDEAEERRSFQAIRELIDASLLERFADVGNPSPVPIFIVGMPRSGTTLLEQILATHPLVHGGGELPVMGRVLSGVTDPAGRPIPYPLYLAKPHAAGLRHLADAYLAGLPALPPGKTRITDKMPANFLCVGLIRLLLPGAKSSTRCATRSTPVYPVFLGCS